MPPGKAAANILLDGYWWKDSNIEMRADRGDDVPGFVLCEESWPAVDYDGQDLGLGTDSYFGCAKLELQRPIACRPRALWKQQQAGPVLQPFNA